MSRKPDPTDPAYKAKRTGAMFVKAVQEPLGMQDFSDVADVLARLPKAALKQAANLLAVARDRQNNAPRLWLRMGDASEYEGFGDDFDALTDAIREYFAESRTLDDYRPAMSRGVRGTGTVFIAPAFLGHNHVSLYWGDADAGYLRDLTDAEFEAVKDAVEAD